jgi:tetratricopeptide (TPR) repeat protein
VQEDKGGEVKQKARESLSQILDHLSTFAASTRNGQLTLLTSWLEQLINQQRSLDLGYKLALWLEKEVNAPLLTRLGDSDSHALKWFSYALHSWALTACNHKGDLVKARKEDTALEELMPFLAGQWEHVSLLMEGLVAQAVHQTDCLEYDVASKRMELVAKYYKDLSSLFIDAFPEVFPERVCSELRGKALGTWLQSEIYAASYDPKRLVKAKEINEQAIEEFPTSSDKERQYQYRCQLETMAGEFQVAREYLAESLGLDAATHFAIADKIKTLDLFPQGFALLHWLRLGTACYLSGDNNSEWQDFASAFKKSGLLNSRWCTEQTDYPAHGILRRVALINAIKGDRTNAAFGRLRNINPLENGSMVLGIIQLAAYAEVAALLWENEPTQALSFLDCKDGNRLGLKQLLEKLSQQSRNLFPAVWDITQKWSAVVTRVLEPNSSENIQKLLLGLGKTISY